MDAAATTLPLGAHLVTPRRGYLHHGIYVGDGRVVHYAGISRSPRGLIEETTLEGFSRGRGIGIVAHAAARYRGWQVVERARRRLGEHAYHLLRNNCEHLCNWCHDGTHRSSQVERLSETPRLIVQAVLRSLAALRLRAC